VGTGRILLRSALGEFRKKRRMLSHNKNLREYPRIKRKKEPPPLNEEALEREIHFRSERPLQS